MWRQREIEQFRSRGSLDPVESRKLSDHFRLEHVITAPALKAIASRCEKQIVLLEGIELNDQPMRDQLEVKDLDAAFRFLEECAARDSALREVDIRNMHSIVVGHQLQAEPWTYRSRGVLMLGSEHRPPEPLAIAGLMGQLIDEQRKFCVRSTRATAARFSATI